MCTRQNKTGYSTAIDGLAMMGCRIIASAFIPDIEKKKRNLWSRIKKDFFRKYDYKRVNTAYIVNDTIYVSPKTYAQMERESKK
jgi:hypothetical protein